MNHISLLRPHPRDGAPVLCRHDSNILTAAWTATTAGSLLSLQISLWGSSIKQPHVSACLSLPHVREAWKPSARAFQICDGAQPQTLDPAYVYPYLSAPRKASNHYLVFPVQSLDTVLVTFSHSCDQTIWEKVAYRNKGLVWPNV